MVKTVQSHPPSPSPEHETASSRNSIEKWYIISELDKGLQRISAANLKHGRQTKDKLEAQRHAAMVGRRVMGELRRLEKQILDAGLMPDD